MGRFAFSNGGMSDIDIFKKNLQAIDFNKIKGEEDDGELMQALEMKEDGSKDQHGVAKNPSYHPV